MSDDLSPLSAPRPSCPSPYPQPHPTPALGALPLPWPHGVGAQTRTGLQAQGLEGKAEPGASMNHWRRLWATSTRERGAGSGGGGLKTGRERPG